MWPGYIRPPMTVRPYPFPIAYPPRAPAYVVPGSHKLDPPYSFMSNPAIPPWWVGQYPTPRLPWPFESETRAPGTGLITTPLCPPAPGTFPPVPFTPAPMAAPARRALPAPTRR